MKRLTVAAARALVKQWRQTFPRAPASVCLALMEVESSFRPDAHAPASAAAIARGVHPSGAWGLLQLLPTTAADMVKKLHRIHREKLPAGLPAPIMAALADWDAQRPECLANPILGSLLGVVYLDHLAERFGPGLDHLAAAYHNGAGFLRDFLASGKKMPDDMPPKGKTYVLRARAVWPNYKTDDDPPPRVT